ncbi:MAG: cob(I)yrinic acid a,c-diamide adenosyltransferase [Thermaerobacter sp.]|nr:cob(I)yrinic acid a,c-diamide adenosyltransferase [Thermaerobacter sp.]
MRSQLERGLIQVYFGSGKGKTTAAVGLGLRAVGHGFTVRMLSFLKGGMYTGELFAVQRLYPLFQISQFGRNCPWGSLIKDGFMHCPPGCRECFIGSDGPTEDDRRIVRLGWEHARRLAAEGEADLLILDEITNALHHGLISLEELLEFLRAKPPTMEYVLTGRIAPPQLREAADLVTEMRRVKHPLQRRIRARRGIEY